MSEERYIYAIYHPHGYFKIGDTKTPKQRLSNIQTGSPYTLELRYLLRYLSFTPGDRSLEEEIHEELSSANVNGEWFEVCENKVIETLAKYKDSPDSAGTRFIDVGFEEQKPSGGVSL